MGQFERLVEEYGTKIFRLAYSMLGDRAAAEDLAQEVFLRIWKGLPGYRREASLSSWVFAIARNTCLSHRRREASRRAASLDVAAVRAEAESLHARSDGHGAALEMWDLLGRIPEKHRRPLMLFYMEDRSYEQVAMILDLPMGTVKTYLHRGKKELGALLEARRKEGALLCPALHSKT
ncbi:MAG: RNA polymerase sigma factor [Bryobacteraceae bacterium]